MDFKSGTPRRYPKILAAFLIIFALSLCAACSSIDSDNFTRVGDPIVTDRLDKNGLPVEAMTDFVPPPTIVYCYLAIRGPAGYKLTVQWYRGDEMLLEEEVDFGYARRAAPSLTTGNGQPLPEGIYRCEYTLGGEEPLRSVGFLVAEVAE